MALLLPTSFSSFGDATATEGPGRVYVLAQVRDTANVEWVAEVRALLDLPELKWTAFKNHRPGLRANRQLWSRIEAGIAQATIVVVDLDTESLRAFSSLIDERGYGFGYDWGDKEMFDLMYRSTIARSPVAFLPDALAKALPNAPKKLGTLDEFTPEKIRERIGPNLRQAAILAARAHAVFDVDGLRRDRTTRTTQDAFTSPFAPVVLTQVLASQRTFDIEAPKTLDVLNHASEAIAAALGPTIKTSSEQLVRECSSAELDQLQAADIAAGWARELIDLGEQRTIASRFEFVWVNGQLLRR
jgi:hypothetical protein